MKLHRKFTNISPIFSNTYTNSEKLLSCKPMLAKKRVVSTYLVFFACNSENSKLSDNDLSKRSRRNKINDGVYTKTNSVRNGHVLTRDTALHVLKSCVPIPTKYFSSSPQLFNVEFLDYEYRQGFYCNSLMWNECDKMSPMTWWKIYGSRDGMLRDVAVKVLAQATSSGAAASNWSVHSIIRTKIRNRMSPKLLDDLVFLYANLRLKNQLACVNSSEEILPWDDEYLIAVPDPDGEDSIVPLENFVDPCYYENL
ncbi:hypothetical protein P9112_004809 [Eukaryota sp. TZLM1-RC]